MAAESHHFFSLFSENTLNQEGNSEQSANPSEQQAAGTWSRMCGKSAEGSGGVQVGHLVLAPARSTALPQRAAVTCR